MATTIARPRTALDVQDLAHTGPGTVAGRYLRSFWQPVYHAPSSGGSSGASSGGAWGGEFGP